MSWLTAWEVEKNSAVVVVLFALSFSHLYVNSPWINDSLNNSNKMKELKFLSYLSFLLASREFNRSFQASFLLLVCQFLVCFAGLVLLSLWLPYIPSKHGFLLHMYPFYHQSVGLSREVNDWFCENLNWAKSNLCNHKNNFKQFV